MRGTDTSEGESLLGTHKNVQALPLIFPSRDRHFTKSNGYFEPESYYKISLHIS